MYRSCLLPRLPIHPISGGATDNAPPPARHLPTSKPHILKLSRRSNQQRHHLQRVSSTRPLRPPFHAYTAHRNFFFPAKLTLPTRPLFFQAVLLTSATTSGLHLILPTLFASLTGTATGLLITRTRRLKWPLLLGTASSLLGTLLLSRLLRRGRPEPVYLLALLPAAAGQGFQFPGTVMALLASSPQREQAVVASALILWRSLGAVLGVAASSLVLQNALAARLDRLVRGPRRDEVVRLVRRSVEAVKALEAPYQDMAIRSYEGALGVTFLACAGVAVGSLLLVLPIRLERLRPRRR